MWTIYHDEHDAMNRPDFHYGEFSTWHEARHYVLRHLQPTHNYVIWKIDR